MTSQTISTKRTSASNSGMGIKMLIMAASLTATLGGWAILAAGQVRDAVAAAQQSQAIVQSASPALQNNSGQTNPSPTLRQATVPNTQPRAVGRTRSSR